MATTCTNCGRPQGHGAMYDEPKTCPNTDSLDCERAAHARTRAQLDEARERLGMATEFNAGDGRIVTLSIDGDGTWWVTNATERTPIGIGDRWNWPTADAAFAALAASRKEQP